LLDEGVAMSSTLPDEDEYPYAAQPPSVIARRPMWRVPWPFIRR
jgi:hypothetical protein